jgi:hypothetical protein
LDFITHDSTLLGGDLVREVDTSTVIGLTLISPVV